MVGTSAEVGQRGPYEKKATPLYWNTDLGNVVAVRTDDEVIAVNDVMMMCHFATHKLQPMF